MGEARAGQQGREPRSWPDARAGFLATLPLWLGVGPFGVVYALAARTAGLGATETVGMSLLVYAGAAQLAATDLIARGAGAASLVLSTLIINLRHVLASASIAPHLRARSWWQRLALAYLLTDETYALSIARSEARGLTTAYYLGAGLGLFLCWQSSTVLGLLLVGAIPDPSLLGLHLVFPLSFLALLRPHLRSHAGWTAALVAGGFALLMHLFVPGNWYVLVAATLGSLAGALLERRR